MSRSADNDYEERRMTDEWGEQENADIEAAMVAEQAKQLASARHLTGYVRYCYHQCLATGTLIGPLAQDTLCPHCMKMQAATRRLYDVVREADTGNVWCMVTSFEHDDSQRRYTLPGYFIHGAAFNFGYAGSGPADLALSIAADFFGEHPTRAQLYHGDCQASRYHQPLKFHFIATRRNVERFTLSSLELEHWLHNIAAKSSAGDGVDNVDATV